MTDNPLRQLPSVDALLGREEARGLIERFGRESAVEALRAALDAARRTILAAGPDADAAAVLSETILAHAGAFLEIRSARTLRRAINATGILMHSGLGRALLSADAREALDEATHGFCTLALDIDGGRRGPRDSHVDGLLRKLTGAEAATICNNNSAATILILNTLARGKEV
ncbi:MAG: L-selenocysteinyl-tRNA(Sec) synthase, partial [Sideroxydans sp.]|nr:L-selenocysteinyl-tRNA(Sec) synthase [Sideroxydans sp.]